MSTSISPPLIHQHIHLYINTIHLAIYGIDIHTNIFDDQYPSPSGHTPDLPSPLPTPIAWEYAYHG